MGVLVRALVVGLAGLALGLVAVSSQVPRIERVVVAGPVHHDEATILALAGIDPGDPLLWVNRWSLRRLTADPWVRRASVVRLWPDTVSIRVEERTPALTDGETSWALDGTVLPDVAADQHASLVRVEGWGEPRSEEAIRLAGLLADFGLEVISYTPEGFDIQLSEFSLFTPGVEELKAQWAAVTSQPGRRMAVYPWGVSIEHE